MAFAICTGKGDVKLQVTMTQSHSGLNKVVYFFHTLSSRIMKLRVGMVTLFCLVLRDPGSYYLLTQMCIVSIPRVTSWSKMAAAAPAFMVTFQPAKCRKRSQ